jgi:phytanoyl-CoA hydroxylase
MNKHELNREFHWQDRSGPFRRLSPEQVRQYDEEGYFVLEDVFDAQTIRRVVELIDPMEAEFEAIVRDKLGGKAFIVRADEITFTAHLVSRSSELRAFTSSEVFQDLAHDLLGPDVRLYWDQSVYKKPGMQAAFPWHQDNGYTFVEPQQYLTCWVALTDASEDNGCPWVLPRCHRGGTLEHHMTEFGWSCIEDTPDGAVVAPVRAGGMVVFSSLTPHLTGPNLSDATRKTYIVQFAPDGAEVIARDGDQEKRVVCNAPERQFPILVGGAAPD